MADEASRRPARRWLLWVAWLGAAAGCAAGLRHFRVSNSMDHWMPDLATAGPYRTYVVVGFSTKQVDAAAVAARLRTLPEVGFCVDPAMVRATEILTGMTPTDFVEGKDGIYKGLFCFGAPGTPDQRLVEGVEQALAPLGDRDAFAIGGPSAFQAAMDRWSQDRLGLILGVIGLVGGAILWRVTGRLSVAAVAMGAIALSQVIFLGAVSWLRIPIDMSLSLVPPMMMGMGYSYAAHRALRRQSLGVLVVCAIAAAAGIASFATADLMPVRHFALGGVAGLVLVWLATVTLVRPDRTARRRRIGWMYAVRRAVIPFALRRKRLIVGVAITVTVAGAVLAPKLRVQANPLNFFPRNSRISRDFDTLDRRLTGMLPSQVVVQGSADPRPMLMRTPGMRKVLDVTAWVAGSARTYLCLANDDAVDSLAREQGAWQAWAREHGVTLAWHGVAPQIHRSAASVREIAGESLPSMAIVIAALIGILFRRWRPAAIGAWTCILPVAALIITAVSAGWRLGPVTLMIGSITAGIAVDDTLHLLTASRRHGSLRRGLAECWKPCVGSSLAGMACFALFMISAFEPTWQFGMLMALATAYAMVANQVLLPAALGEAPARATRAEIPSTVALDSGQR